jgi:membrane protein required for colicin V production
MRNTDILLIVPLVWGTYRGFYRGLISEITSLVAIIIVFYVSVKYYAAFATFLNSHIHSKLSPTYLSIASFVLLFLFLFVIFYAVSLKIERMTEALHISLINHLAGGLFGFAKWAFMVSMVISLLSMFGNQADFTLIKFNHTLTYYHLQVIAPNIMPGLLGKNP